MRKKPTNLTLSDDIRARAARLMVMQSFSSFSTYVEHLIRTEHARQFPDQMRDAIVPKNVTQLHPTAELRPPRVVSYRKGRKK